jgi:predicted heme/steroid binding protein
MVKLKPTNQPMSAQFRFLCCIPVFVCAIASGQDGAQRAFMERYGTPEGKAKAARAAPQSPPVYRIVEGKVYDVSHNVLWKHIDGECLTVLSDGIILQEMKTNRVYKTTRGSLTPNQSVGAYAGPAASYVASETREPGKRIFLRNYPSSLWPTTGKWIQGLAMQTGVFQRGNETLEQWDYGVDYTPQPRKLTPEEVAAAKTEADRKKAVGDAAALRFYQEQAEKGDAYGQYRMGIRYLKGDGVPKDLAKARDYLSKAAAQGNKEAAAELAKLPLP